MKIGQVAENNHKYFADKFPGYYDYVVDMVETLNEEDCKVLIQVMVLEWMRQHWKEK